MRASAPPRLWAHLTLVHDVAVRLCRECARRWPAWRVDVAQVAFGAATHDLGKALVPSELSEPGSRHEELGERFLLDAGVDAQLARFARTHAQWSADSSPEELLVSLADKIWKAKRDESLENLVMESISRASGAERWEIFERLDAVLTGLAAAADDRLEWQNAFSVNQ